ncbi:MAG: RsmD family RNA methyltransferase, partial [Actinobacteria bacterium]|nr:RsmD family RNA methyltransferase [Actinomycetota bacterium]
VPRGTRPVSDRAREGLFSSLGGAVSGARVLDLYAGTGALGLEACSRGAVSATFVDRDRAATAAIRNNVARTRVEQAEVVTADVEGFLGRAGASAAAADLAFLDPPYDLEGSGLDRVLAQLGSRLVAGSGWTVVLTRGSRTSTPVIPLHWGLTRRLSYGDSLVFLYREV